VLIREVSQLLQIAKTEAVSSNSEVNQESMHCFVVHPPVELIPLFVVGSGNFQLDGISRSMGRMLFNSPDCIMHFT
jgi:hypothetical protein